MYEYIPDYTELHAMHEAELDRQAAKCPKCTCCGEHILDETFYNIEGKYICERCIEDFIVDTEDYME